MEIPKDRYTDMIVELFKETPLVLYDYLLRDTMSTIYTVKKESKVNGWQNYSNLLIDKFAIHSSSFYHLSNGIIEHRKSGEEVRMNGYDLFTVNAIFRTIMETYATFNHIFVEPNTEEEKEFRFLLWKIDGLTEKARFDIKDSDYEEAKEALRNDRKVLDETINAFENCIFYKSLSNKQIEKIFIPTKKRYYWRFNIIDGEVKILKIIELIKHVFSTRAFINSYKHTSIHTHSNYYAIEEFEKIRGKTLSKEYTDPLTRLAIITTCMIIDDMCKLDKNAMAFLSTMPYPIYNLVKGMSDGIRRNK